MRTLIRGGWVVGFERGTHMLVRNGVVVYEGDRILYVGPRFDGDVDRSIDAADKLVAPGFIDLHVHSGHRASSRLLTDAGRRDYFGQPFLDLTVPREGTQVGGDPRYDDPKRSERGIDLGLWAHFTAVELLRNGVTTFVEFGSQLRVQEALLKEVSRLGSRAYLGPGYDCGRWAGDERGRLKRVVNEPAGWRDFEGAQDFIKRVDGSCDGRVRGILVPRDIETSSLDLLRATREAANRLRVPITIHAAYDVREFHEIVAEHRMSPIEVLDTIGLLGPDVTIGHGNFIAENPLLNFSGGRDLDIMAQRGVSISHCPVNLVRRARFLDSWERYRKAGVNIALGTDTYPRDLIMQMRMASYFGKVLSHNFFAASAAEVFEAATLGGARAVGRDDLGRLAAGAQADIIVIDITGGDTLRFGPVRDPIKSLVECGIGDDVETVIVSGHTRMEGRRIPGVEIAALRREAQAAGEAIWGGVQEWDSLRRTVEEISPWSFPLVAS